MISSTLFSDFDNNADFILVYEKGLVNESLNNYFASLQKMDLDLVHKPGTTLDHLIFVKVTANDTALRNYAKLYNIEIMSENVYYVPNCFPELFIFANEIVEPDKNGTVYPRARRILSQEKPNTLTKAERIMIVYSVLKNAEYIIGDETIERGFSPLLKKNILLGVYPLHENGYKWTENGPLSRRQLLAKYWASCKNLFYMQPIYLIHQYFGHEAAFYFAWLEFYCKMLVVPSVLGVFSLFYGLITMRISNAYTEVCTSTEVLCPTCVIEKLCEYKYLNSACKYATYAHLCDNVTTVILSFFMLFWASFFLVVWKRKLQVLNVRWGLRSSLLDVNIRPEYYKDAKSVTLPDGTVRYTVSKTRQYVTKFVSATVCISLSLFIFVHIFLGILVKFFAITSADKSENETIRRHATTIGVLAISAFHFIFFTIMMIVYRKVALYVTRLENPRTKTEFEKDHLYKIFGLSFALNYFIYFYMIFFKGRFFTHPGSRHLQTIMGTFAIDHCNPGGCVTDLAILIFSLLTYERIKSHLSTIFMPITTIIINMIKFKKKWNDQTPQWEKDYYLEHPSYYHLKDEITQMILQYGYIIFFIGVFPLLPLLVLINNIIELRIDAWKLVYYYRRIIPRNVYGFEMWSNLFKFITYFGIVVNAFIIAFGSEFVPKMIYMYFNNFRATGYINSTLSAYATIDLPNREYKEGKDPEICYYYDKRYPPDHVLKYKHTPEYFKLLLVRFIFVVIFEHLSIITIKLIEYAVPKVPFQIRKILDEERQLAYEARIKNVPLRYERILNVQQV